MGKYQLCWSFKSASIRPTIFLCFWMRKRLRSAHTAFNLRTQSPVRVSAEPRTKIGISVDKFHEIYDVETETLTVLKFVGDKVKEKTQNKLKSQK